MPIPAVSFLDTDVKFLKGVGEARGNLLSKELSIKTFRDLLYYFPFRYIDRSKYYRIADFAGVDMPALQVKGQFVSFREEGEGSKRRLVGLFNDGSRMMEVLWFAGIQKIKNMYQPGRDYVVFGKPTFFRNAYSMTHPEVEAYNPERPPEGLRGVYSLTDNMRKRGFTQRLMQTIMRNLIDHPGFSVALAAEVLPPAMVSALGYPSLCDSLRAAHFPDSPLSMQRAIERLKFEELFYIELNILRISGMRHQASQGYLFTTIGEAFRKFYGSVIPFDLTGAQKRVLHEIRDDMRTGHQMNRLLQGDVGSGKTMVAFMTMLMAIDNGFQACLMAPTEILATQHYESLLPWAEALGVKIDLLTGSSKTKHRREIDEGLREGSLQILVGTHALLEEKVEFSRLGVAIIDEQHRFGVAQRARLWKKGDVPPHVLVMTATPIPRTLAMTVYGDLDVSVIDELPPGRKPIDTMLRFDDSRMEVNRLIGRELKAGRQVYIVYPLVKENDKLSLKSVEEGFNRIQGIFTDYKVVCVHGQLKPEVKDAAMQRFVSGEARIMVATTVIEVGVNVPNASVMVIENAERFGLSQLHQLRGRVGRGADKSYCILMSHHKIGTTTRKRLSIMTETTDGFLISEADMKLRGPGDMEGTQQSGIPFNLKIANLCRDGQIVGLARKEAEKVLSRAAESKLSSEEISILNRELIFRFSHQVDWSRIS